MSDHAWLIPALPAVSAALIIFFGKRLPKGGAEVGIAAIGLAFLLSVGVAVQVFSANVAAVAQVPHAEEEARGGTEVAALGAGGGLLAAAAEPEEETIEIPAGVSAFVNERSVQLTPFGGEYGFEAGIRVDGLAAMMFL
ncbi:MAG: hypothetical protein M3425_12585, partial [Actinomycetota bacterium]|nr:hypothetical protein [Actinomycetota bacterium]